MSERSSKRSDYIGTPLPEGTESFDHCKTCNILTLQTVVKVMLYSPGGARSITVWSCENHPTPDSLIDE